MFIEAYGIELIDGEDSRDARVLADERYVNWYGTVYGGCFLALALASARKAVGFDAHCSFLSASFLRSVELHSDLGALTHIEKDGRRFVNCQTDVSANGKLALRMESEFLKDQELLVRQQVEYDTGSRRPWKCDFVLNSVDAPSTPPEGASLQSVFSGISQRARAEKLDLCGATSIGMYTDDAFSDGRGFVDPSIFATLADDALGVASWSLLNDNVTTHMTISLLGKAPIGSFVSCSAHAVLATDCMSAIAGELWSNGDQIGFCSATFFKN